jgi:hypothetical protein
MNTDAFGVGRLCVRVNRQAGSQGGKTFFAGARGYRFPDRKAPVVCPAMIQGNRIQEPLGNDQYIGDREIHQSNLRSLLAAVLACGLFFRRVMILRVDFNSSRFTILKKRRSSEAILHELQIVTSLVSVPQILQRLAIASPSH